MNVAGGSYQVDVYTYLMPSAILCQTMQTCIGTNFFQLRQSMLLETAIQPLSRARPMLYGAPCPPGVRIDYSRAGNFESRRPANVERLQPKIRGNTHDVKFAGSMHNVRTRSPHLPMIGAAQPSKTQVTGIRRRAVPKV